MIMALEDYIKDNLEDSMSDYIETANYIKSQEKINIQIKVVKEKLRSEDIPKLNNLLDLISNSHSEFASEAYFKGVMDGFNLKNRNLS